MAERSGNRTQRVLPVSCLSPKDGAFVVHFPLHELTRSPDHVGRLSDELLNTITSFVDGGEAVGNGDVLQALVIALAVRARVIDAPTETTHGLSRDLLDRAFLAIDDARSVPGGRA